MAKDAYYFSHDSNARNDPKILMLRADYGMEGLGFYWCLIEIMAEQADYKINTNDSKQIKAFALHLNSKTEFLLELIENCVSEYGDKTNGYLFKKDKDGFIYSESLLRRMQLKDAIREKRKQAGKKGGKAKANSSSNEQANAKQEPSKDEASEKQVSSNEKEKKGKEKENEKESKRKINHLLPEDWTPSERHKVVLRDKGLSENLLEPFIEKQFKKMKAWSIEGGNKRKNWDLTFDNWLENSDIRNFRITQQQSQNPFENL